MNIEKELYNAFYWYFRKQYGQVADHIAKENTISILKTKNSETYVREKIIDLITTLRSV